MPLAHYENWDGVAAPAVPGGWTAGTGWATSTAAHGFTPTSSPNMAQYTTGSNGTYYLTYGTPDGNAGNCVVQANLGIFGATGQAIRLGVTARGSSATPGGSATMYAAWLDWGNSEVGISKIVSGTETAIATTSTGSLSSPVWYTAVFQLNNSALQLLIIRLSDGHEMDSSGNFVPAAATAASVTDGTISGSGYCGLYAVQSGTGFWAESDDWYLNTLNPVVLPTRPLVVSYPFAYYPAIAE
jgi:hypothetical protein